MLGSTKEFFDSHEWVKPGGARFSTCGKALYLVCDRRLLVARLDVAATDADGNTIDTIVANEVQPGMEVLGHNTQLRGLQDEWQWELVVRAGRTNTERAQHCVVRRLALDGATTASFSGDDNSLLPGLASLVDARASTFRGLSITPAYVLLHEKNGTVSLFPNLSNQKLYADSTEDSDDGDAVIVAATQSVTDVADNTTTRSGENVFLLTSQNAPRFRADAERCVNNEGNPAIYYLSKSTSKGTNGTEGQLQVQLKRLRFNIKEGVLERSSAAQRAAAAARPGPLLAGSNMDREALMQFLNRMED